MKAKLALLLSFLILSAGISVVIAQENIFTVRQPDYQKSPYTGMTRRHWIQAGEYLLKGAFNYIHTLDDQMYFPKQLEKTYPKSEGQVPVAKLEGLARTLFVAAPLLKDNPELENNYLISLTGETMRKKTGSLNCRLLYCYPCRLLQCYNP